MDEHPRSTAMRFHDTCMAWPRAPCIALQARHRWCAAPSTHPPLRRPGPAQPTLPSTTWASHRFSSADVLALTVCCEAWTRVLQAARRAPAERRAGSATRVRAPSDEEQRDDVVAAQEPRANFILTLLCREHAHALHARRRRDGSAAGTARAGQGCLAHASEDGDGGTQSRAARRAPRQSNSRPGTRRCSEHVGGQPLPSHEPAAPCDGGPPRGARETTT